MLFVDLVGFTSLAEGRDPEEVRDLLTRYFSVCRDAIARYGGTVEKFIGDAVMAVWGSPVAREDDGARAVRAAVELLNGVSELGSSLGIGSLLARAGVTTGEALATVDVVGEGMVAGDLVNTAARLQSVSEPGVILVDEATRRAVGDTIQFEGVDAVVLRGKAGATRAFRVIDVPNTPGDRDSSARLDLPFVNRAEELGTLRPVFEKAAHEGGLHVAFIFGIGGIGKSRLVWEVEKADWLPNAMWLHARASAYEQNASFLPLVQILRSALGLDESDDRETAAARLRDLLNSKFRDADERAWIEPQLMRLMGVGSESGGERHELFAAVRTFIERIAGDALTVFVFDDAQWGDDGVFDFLDHLVDYASTAKALILVVARPEILDQRGDWFAGVSAAISMSLPPLSDAHMLKLLEGVVSASSTAAFAPIVERADGVPLYAAETMRTLIDDGRITLSDTGYSLSGPINEIEVPRSLNALVAARLDVLPEVENAVIKDASVLGPGFSLGALAHIRPETSDELRGILRSLVRRRLLALDNDDPRYSHRTIYAFIGGLVPEIAYQMVSKRDRFERHVAAARYFETDPLEGDPIIAAGHYAKAMDNASDEDVESIGTSAKAAYSAAALHAVERGSSDRALGYLESALELSDNGAERARIREAAADLALRTSQAEVAELHLREALDYHEKELDAIAIARVSARLGGIRLSNGDSREGMERLEAGLGALVGMGEFASHPDIPRFAVTLSQALLTRGSFLQAENWADEGLAGAEELDQPDVIADAMIAKGRALNVAGRWRNALGLLMAARAMAEEFDFRRVRLEAHFALATVWQFVQPKRALAEIETAALLARRLGLADLEARAIAEGTWLALWIGGRSEIDRLFTDERSVFASGTISPVLKWVTDRVLDGELEEALDTLRQLQGNTTIALFPWIAELRLLKHAASGDAQRVAMETLESIKTRADFLRSARPIAQAGRALLWKGDFDGVASAVAILNALTPTKAPWVELTKEALAASLESFQGGPPAVARMEHAIGDAAGIGAGLDQALLQLDIAFLPNSDPALEEYSLSASRELFTRLGAEGLWKRVSAAHDWKGSELA